jgi:hypothetical protein
VSCISCHGTSSLTERETQLAPQRRLLPSFPMLSTELLDLMQVGLMFAYSCLTQQHYLVGIVRARSPTEGVRRIWCNATGDERCRASITRVFQLARHQVIGENAALADARAGTTKNIFPDRREPPYAERNHASPCSTDGSGTRRPRRELWAHGDVGAGESHIYVCFSK